jgi:hypothetical protein
MDSENSVLVRSLGTVRQEGFVKTRVVGLGGCMFVNDEPLGVGTFLDLALAISGEVAHTKGRIVYEIPRRQGVLEVGVEFVSLSEEDRSLIGALFSSAGHC